MTEILYDFTLASHPRILRACRVCQDWGKLYEDEDGFLLVDCIGPCNGSGFTDLPLPENAQCP